MARPGPSTTSRRCASIPGTGALSPHGAPIQLPTRPIHISMDIPSENILVAFNNPSAVRVYRVKADFTPGEEVMQPARSTPASLPTRCARHQTTDWRSWSLAGTKVPPASRRTPVH